MNSGQRVVDKGFGDPRGDRRIVLTGTAEGAVHRVNLHGDVSEEHQNLLLVLEPLSMLFRGKSPDKLQHLPRGTQASASCRLTARENIPLEEHPRNEESVDFVCAFEDAVDSRVA